MALLDLLTPENIADRFYTLPESVQNALEDPAGRSVVHEACAANGVTSEDDIQAAEAVMASALLGFVHIDDLEAPLAENSSIPPEAVKKIAATVRTKVLEPLRKDIESIYEPIDAPAAAVTDAPPVAPFPGPAPLPISDIPSVPAPMPASAAPAPSCSMPPTAPGVSKAPVPPAPQAGAAPQPVEKPAQPAPFILRQESSASPLATGVGFKLNVPTDIFKASTPAKKIDVPMPPKAAELEIGKAPAAPKPPTTSFRSAPAPSRVVHYADLRTPIVPPAPVPPAPIPSPASSPKPSMPIAPGPMPQPMNKPSSVSTPPAKAPTAPVPPRPMAPSQPVVPPPPSKPAPIPVDMSPMPPAPSSSSAPSPMTSMPKAPSIPAVPPAPMPPQAPGSAPAPAPGPKKPPKVVNFGPEEVK